MKKLLFLLTAATISLAGIGQGKSKGKGQVKSNGKQVTGKSKDQQPGIGKADLQFNQKVWAGTNDGNGGKARCLPKINLLK